MGAVSVHSEQQLESLLENDDDALGVRCLTALRAAPESHQVTGPIPIQNIRGIYRLRADNNLRRGNPIQGFDALLAGLESMTAEAVLIHSVKTPEQSFLIFTDSDTAHIAGVLELPVSVSETSTIRTTT